MMKCALARRSLPWPTSITLLLVALVATWLASAASTPAQESLDEEPARTIDRRGDLISVFSGGVEVPAHVRQRGTVVCIGGTARIEGRVTEDVVVILGGLELSGSVGGAVTGVLSDVELRDAEVRDQLVGVLSALELERSTVYGEFVNILGSLDRDELSELRHQLVNIGFGGDWFPSFWSLFFWVRLLHKFLVFVLLLLLVLLIPERIRLIGDEAPVRYVAAFFVGLLGYLAMLVVIGLLSVTVVGIFPAAFAFYVLKWMGIAAIFYAVGRRIGRGVGASLSVPGSVLLVFFLYVGVMLAPTLLGWIGLAIVGVLKLVFFLLIEAPAVGLVILTRFGNPRPHSAIVKTPVPPEPAPAPPPSPGTG